MNNECRRTEIVVMITIVDRGQGEKATLICSEHHTYFNLITLGLGTAKSEILDLLGIGETKKDVVISISPKEGSKALMSDVAKKMKLSKAGNGISITIPISGATGRISRMITEACEESEVRTMENLESSLKNELIIAIVNQGYTDELMESATEAGAVGGTVLHARGMGYEKAEQFLGISIQAEKEIVLIITDRSKKQPIMQALIKSSGLKTEAKGIVISVPVLDTEGTSMIK